MIIDTNNRQFLTEAFATIDATTSDSKHPEYISKSGWEAGSIAKGILLANTIEHQGRLSGEKARTL